MLIRSFSIEYCHQTAERAAANTSLGAHRDDSHLTINLCLFSDAAGSELQFDRTQADFCYEHRAGRGVSHRGDLVHTVLPLRSGRRENIIIWVSFDSAALLDTAAAACPVAAAASAAAAAAAAASVAPAASEP